MTADDRGPTASRRAVLAAAGAIGATAACGAPPPADAPSSSESPVSSGSSISSGLTRTLPSVTHSPRLVGRTDEIPVGGGRVYPGARVVVTQPAAGEFRGFGIVCTHDGCELNAVAGGTINCPCHGSRYALTDGSVVRGPARTGLRTERITVDGDRILVL